MARALLDTSVLVAADERLDLELPPSAAISVITVGELVAGVRLARSPASREERVVRLAAVRRAFLPLPVDEEVAERYGDVLAAARRRRRAVKATDLLIVATALASRRTLYTLDGAQASLAQLVDAPVRTV
ncbi:MAG: type II toxin-antitoxin system VapC family toxin [Pseudonocardiaceae bacterium]